MSLGVLFPILLPILLGWGQVREQLGLNHTTWLAGLKVDIKSLQLPKHEALSLVSAFLSPESLDNAAE